MNPTSRRANEESLAIAAIAMAAVSKLATANPAA
jgi:hypothetical protein